MDSTSQGLQEADRDPRKEGHLMAEEEGSQSKRRKNKREPSGEERMLT